MNQNKSLALINTVLFIATIVVNGLANALPINGLNTGQVSQLYPSAFTPAGITFSIWSVIYLLLAGFVIFQWKNFHQPYFKRLSVLFLLTCLLNISWILVWHHLLPGLSVILMLLFLVVLTNIFLLLQRHPEQSNSELILIHLPFTLYFAWICVATIANISAWLVSLNWTGSPLQPQHWAIMMMVAAASLATVIVLRFQRYAVAVVVSWALIGIALRDQPLVTPIALVLVFLLMGVALYKFTQTRRGFAN